MNEKYLGYSLLAAGVVMMLFAGFDVFQVFTGEKKPYPLFRLSGITVNFSEILKQQATNVLPTDMELPPGINLNSMLESVQSQNNTANENSGVQEVISAEMMNTPMNLFAHVFLMGFFASIGMKIATVGTYLIRTIEVKLKESPLQGQTHTNEQKNGLRN